MRMDRASLLHLLFSVGEHVAELRSEVESVADTLAESEREYFLRVLCCIESRNAELMLAWRHRGHEH